LTFLGTLIAGIGVIVDLTATLAPIETRLAVGPAVRPAERFSPPLASPPGLVASPEIFPVSG
jgi:hypothetical protein